MSRGGGPDFATLAPTGIEPKIHSIFDITEETLNQLRLWIEMHPPNIPIKQVIGFSAFTANQAQVLDADTTSSATYVDLTHPGPTLTGLPAGKYVLLFGCVYSNTSASDGFISPSVNGSTPSDSDGAQTQDPSSLRVNMMRAVTVDLTTDSNTVKLQYRVGAPTGSFQTRWLIALKYS